MNIGSLWTVGSGKWRSTYEVIGTDGGDFVMCRVSEPTPEMRLCGAALGDTMRVEAAWFSERADVREVTRGVMFDG